MLDPLVRKLIDPPLAVVARVLSKRGVRANQVTIAGLALGLGAVPCLATQHYRLALVFIALNRIFDGLDGAVARERGTTDLGGYLDAVADFLFYGAIVFGFALGRPEHAPYATFLLFSFMGTGSTFLTYAAIAAKRGLENEQRGQKAFYYLGGLTEGTETVIAFALFCLFPDAFPWLAMIFGSLCFVTTATRVAAAWQSFR